MPNTPKEMWTQLQALDLKTGKIVWTTECGINMGVSVTPQKLNDGRKVVVTGRGGGHGPTGKTPRDFSDRPRQREDSLDSSS